MRNLWIILFTGVVYFILARLSLLFQLEDSNATPVWPPSGFSLAMILIYGFRVIPGIALGAFSANLITLVAKDVITVPASALTSLAICTGNTLEAVLAALLLKRFVSAFDINTFPTKIHHIMKLMYSGMLACVAGGIIGPLAVYMAGLVSPGLLPEVMLTWWLGDFSGIIVVTSTILIWRNSIREGFGYSIHARRVEIVSLYALAVFSGGIVFNEWLNAPKIFHWPYWIIPIAVWSAIRFSSREVINVIFIITVMAVWGTVNNSGPFDNQSTNLALLTLQAFVCIITLTGLMLNVFVQQRRELESDLRKISEELEQRVAERTQQLEERNRFVEKLLDASADAIYVVDKDMRLLLANKVGEQIIGSGSSHVSAGRKFPMELFSAAGGVEVHDVEMALRGIPLLRQERHDKKNDAYFETDIIPLDNKNEVMAVMIICRDISKRIQIESEINERRAFAELLIESSPYMIMALDKELHLTSWNKQCEEHTRISKDLAIGKKIFELFPMYSDEEWHRNFHEVLAEGKTRYYPKVKFLYTPGWGECFINPLYNGKKEIIGVLSITRNITDEVQLSRELEQKNLALEKMNEELSSFAYVASHDLQEPLRKIQMFGNRILEKEAELLSEAGKDYFSRMIKAAERMSDLISDLLSYSTTNSKEVSFEVSSLDAMLEGVIEDLRDVIHEKDARIHFNSLGSVKVIPFQFRQLLNNLISNSIKFSSDDKKPEIMLRTETGKGIDFSNEELEKERLYTRLTISDNGIGFQQEYARDIFKLFQRLHGRTKYKGTGLGLAIAKKVVENHQGHIFAESEPGKGATFLVYLPS